MGREVWLWIKEKTKALFAWFWLKVKRGLGLLLESMRGFSGQTWRRLSAGLGILIIVYLVVGAAIVHRWSDGLDLEKPPIRAGQSETVATLIAVIERETVDGYWTPNDPFFQPGWWIDNTPNFQEGMIGAVSRLSLELRDQLGRMRGSSTEDPDLETAAGQLAVEPRRWWFGTEGSRRLTAPADTDYRQAAISLRRYNDRLANGEAVFERRSDNLLGTLDRIAADLGASATAINDYVRDHAGGFLPDTGADDQFYRTRGQLMAYYLVLEALEKDFGELLVSRDVEAIYKDMLVGLKRSAALDPMVVMNGSQGSLLPNHLSEMGFGLERARNRLREIRNILLK